MRLATTAITLAGVAVIVFFVIRVVPGNPIAMMLPPGATEEDIARLSALYGLDKPLITSSASGSRASCRATSAPRSPPASRSSTSSSVAFPPRWSCPSWPSSWR